MAITRKTIIIKWIGLTINVGVTLGALVGLYFGGVSWFAFGFFVVSAYFCMLAHETFYHRYFAHQSFKTSRPVQFVMGLLAELAPVRGPIWWAATHRDHHKYTDTTRDPHSPIQGFAQSYMGWVYNPTYIAHNYKNVADLTRCKELLVIDRLFWLPMVLSFIGVYALGAYLEKAYPQLGTSGLQLLVWGGFLRVLYPIHIMALINYFSHSTYWKFGYRNFDSPDTSRNLPLLGYLGAGVGWHNNHHRHGRYASTRVMWWELDASGALIWLLEKCGLVWNVRWIPDSYREEARAYRAALKAGLVSDIGAAPAAEPERRMAEVVPLARPESNTEQLAS